MTDPAPPARTILTPEGWAEQYRRGYDSIDEVLAAAMTAARAGGRLAGLEEAATAFSRIGADDGRGTAMLMSCGWVIQKLRRLAEDVPQAPEDPENSAPRVPR